MKKKDTEQYIIEKLSSRYSGDDAAIADGLLYSMDAFFEGTHFERAWMTPAQIARKAMLVNFSDAVAMNAKPRYALITLAVPGDMQRSEIDELTESFRVTAAEFDCEIIGGDTIRSDKLHIAVTVISRSDDPLMRTGLKEGSLLAFTGTLGQSKRDLDRLLAGEKIDTDSRFYEPVLRSEFVAKVRPCLQAGLDISDGLYCDTNTLLNANEYGMNILINITEEMGASGEEYEMLIGFDMKEKEQVEKIAKACNLPLTIFAVTMKNRTRFPCKSHHF